MQFDGEVLRFNIFDAMRFPAGGSYLFPLDAIDEVCQDIYELALEDELLTILAQSLDQFVFQKRSLPCS